MVKTSDSPTTQAIDEIPFNRFHLRVTVMTFGANFTDGYILGMIGALLPALTAGWSLTGLESGLLPVRRSSGCSSGAWCSDAWGTSSGASASSSSIS